MNVRKLKEICCDRIYPDFVVVIDGDLAYVEKAMIDGDKVRVDIDLFGDCSTYPGLHDRLEGFNDDFDVEFWFEFVKYEFVKINDDNDIVLECKA